MSGGLGAAGTQAFWYLTRGTGVVALLLLTAVVALGIAGRVGWEAPRWPRFLTQGLHRNLSLLAVAFLGVHVAAAVIDGFSPIRWIDTVVPFGSAYRPVWVGLGAVGFDLLLALVFTSLLRARLGYRSWRAVHWLAYACWPVALVHGLGTGSDTQQVWMLALDALALAVVLAAVRWRLTRTRPGALPQAAAVGASVLGTVALMGFVVAGPLGAGWARTAGTPSQLIGSVAAQGSSPAPGAPTTVLPGSSAFSGRATQRSGAGGGVEIEFRGTLNGAANGSAAGARPLSLDIRLQGRLVGDAISVQGGTVRLGTSADPTLLRGSIAGVQDGRIVAQLTDGAGTGVTLDAALRVLDAAGATRGVVDLSNGAIGSNGANATD